jgi:hypothetical protein
MKAPSPGDLIIAVKVLEAYRERLHIEAANSIVDLPETSLGLHHAGRIGTKAIEMTGRVDELITNLNDWRQSLRQKIGVRV